MRFHYATPAQCAIAAAITATVLAAAGCDRSVDSKRTVGQKVDSAIDKTNSQLAAASDKVERKVGEAGAALADVGESITSSTSAAVDKAGNVVASKVEQIGAIVDDSAITASIKADLLKDPGLSALGIEVNTVKGEVTLKGEVSTEIRRQRAEGIARNIVGVTKVTNLLTVRAV